MGTKVLGPDGRPFDTVERRRRMGFLGGDLIADHETVSAVTPPERTYSIETDRADETGLPEKIHASERSR